MLGIGNGGVRAQFEAWNRKFRRSSQVPTLGIVNGMEWKSSSQVRCFESGIEEFEPSSRLGIGKGGVRAKFGSLELGLE